MQFKTSIYLDKRKSSKKVSGLYPLKLRVYSNITQKIKLYKTGIDLSPSDYESMFGSRKRLSVEKKDIKIKIQEIENRAFKVAQGLNTFTFEMFEKKMFRSNKAANNINLHYSIKIKTLLNNHQISTASGYRLSLKSLSNFISKNYNQNPENITFYEITPEWLLDYERFMISDLNKSITTVSIYLRALKAVFNDAISDGDIPNDIYPFGSSKGKYQIPSAKKNKKALSTSQLRLLYNYKPTTKEQERAKDFWFFSYACNGMNMKDMLLLRNKNIHNDYITYFRSKTNNTRKGNLKEIKVSLNDFCKDFISKYRINTGMADDFLLPIINRQDSPNDRHKKIKNFTSHINLHLNKLAKEIGFDFKLSTYWARHSFATFSIRQGYSMEFVSEALNHSNLNVTKAYFAGFEDETKKEFSNRIMNFE